MFRLPRPSRRTWILVGLGLLWALSTDGLWQRLFSPQAPDWPALVRGLALLLPGVMLALVLCNLPRFAQPRHTQPSASTDPAPLGPAQDLTRGLHDQLGHSLIMARLQVDQLLSHRPTEPQASSIARLSTHLNDALTWVRRTLGELTPATLGVPPLPPALPVALAELVRSTAPWPAGLRLRLKAEPGTAGLRWPLAVEAAATLVAREALLNAVRHASASEINLLLGGDERCLRLAVQDNGIGLPPALERSRPGHHGLSGMRDTAQAVGADLTLSCMPTDGGTQVAFVWRA